MGTEGARAMFIVHHRHTHNYDQRSLSEVKAELMKLHDLITSLPEKIMANIRPEIQAVLDAINGLSAPLAALEAAQADEMKQIADLTAKVTAGAALTDDEKSALSGAVSTVNTAIAGVVAATPAATTAAAAATT
jgi:hypothetical protein